MKPRSAQRGVTAIEIIVAVAIGGLVVAIAIPSFTTVLEHSRLDAASRQLSSALWNAHSKAVATGWEYKLFGFGNASTDARRNQYRLLGRRSSATAWPGDTDAPFSSTTQSAGPWTDLSMLSRGIQLLPGGTGTNARFEIAFNSRGALSVNTGDFSPFRLQVKDSSRLIRVSVVGGVTVE
jgi:prepilin-type N-terminal cleavage/methylation domain-containing protein